MPEKVHSQNSSRGSGPNKASPSGASQETGFPVSTKKILPFWLAAVLVAVAGIIILHTQSVRIINYIEYPETNRLLLADNYLEEAEKIYRDVAGQYAALQGDDKRTPKMKSLPALERARNLFLESLNLKPNAPLVYKYLSDLAAFEGDLPAMHYYQGKRALLEKNMDAARDSFNQALSLDAAFQPAQEAKIKVLIESGHLDQAERSLEKLFSLSPNHAEAYYLKAQLYKRRHRQEEYREALEETLRLNPTHLDAPKNLADLLIKKGSEYYGQAISILEKARKAHPDDANLLHRLGQAYMVKKDYGEAVEVLEEAVEYEKHSASLYFDLARAYEKQGKGSRASWMLEKAIEIDPRFRKRILFPEKE